MIPLAAALPEAPGDPEEALARLEPAAEWNGRFGQTPEARRLIGRVRTDLEFLSPEAIVDGLPGRLAAARLHATGHQILAAHGPDDTHLSPSDGVRR